MRRWMDAAAVACAAVVAGCGGGDSADSGSASGGGGSGGSTAQGAALTPAAAKGAKGNVTLCLPKDVSGSFHKTIAAFNKQQSAVKATLLELSESADEQRNQLIQR